MESVRLCMVLVLCMACRAAAQVGLEWGDTADMITSQDYRVETHQVTTEDGYILTMHRIPYSYNEVPSGVSKPVVFLMHGLTSASHAYVFVGREFSIAYNLADAGFDVWMGNARGNAFSRAHETLDPDNSADRLQFYDFSWDEIGTIDLPTMIDYTLQLTGRDELHYIGHSQGGTVFLVLNSIKPEYNAKFSSAHLLAGVGYKEYFPQPLLRTLAQRTDFLFGLAVSIGFVELSPMQPMMRNNLCHADPALVEMCSALQSFQLADFLMDNLTETERNNTIQNYGIVGGTAGAAVKQFAHYGQNIQALTFRRWNYGPEGNLAAYGTTEAPIYDISRITVNTVMHYTIGDELLDERDVLNMAAVMPNCVARKVARDSFTHGDFAVALDAKELVTDFIIESMLKYEYANVRIPVDNSALSLTTSFIVNMCIIFLFLFNLII